MNTGSMPSLVDEALIPTLELVQSKQHSDLVLRCMPNGVVLHALPGSIVSKGGIGSHPLPELACEMRSFSRNQASRKVHNSTKADATTPKHAAYDLQKEAAKLRLENEELRNR